MLAVIFDGMFSHRPMSRDPTLSPAIVGPAVAIVNAGPCVTANFMTEVEHAISVLCSSVAARVGEGKGGIRPSGILQVVIFRT